MKRFFKAVCLAALLACAALPAFGQEDREGTKDYPGITRMPGYYIDRSEDVQFDSVDMPVKQGTEEKKVAVEGHVHKIYYYVKQGTPATSMLQVIRNYQNAVRTAGGKVVDDEVGGNWRSTTMRLGKNNLDIWILLEARDDNHLLTVVEKQVMQQDVAVNADSLARDLNESGRAAIYGIYFDTGKSELKPESQPAIEAIAGLLKQAPALKVFIVGHTDMVGDTAMNVKLSQARAQSVVAELTSKHGIAPSRLTAFGNGPYAPVASNKSDEGRAKNRRVELVEIAAE